MKRIQQALALSVVSLVSAGTLIASPAHAAVADDAGCPTPTKAEVKRSKADKGDRPPRGANAIRGVRVNYIPKGFSSGRVYVGRYNGVSEYGYIWTDTRDELDRKHRDLWVRVACWPKADKLSRLRDIPFGEGTFGAAKIAKIGGRTVLAKEGDGALGDGRYVGWVERKGTVVTVMASQPLVPELDKIIKGIRLP